MRHKLFLFICLTCTTFLFSGCKDEGSSAILTVEYTTGALLQNAGTSENAFNEAVSASLNTYLTEKRYLTTIIERQEGVSYHDALKICNDVATEKYNILWNNLKTEDINASVKIDNKLQGYITYNYILMNKNEIITGKNNTIELKYPYLPGSTWTRSTTATSPIESFTITDNNNVTAQINGQTVNGTYSYETNEFTLTLDDGNIAVNSFVPNDATQVYMRFNGSTDSSNELYTRNQ